MKTLTVTPQQLEQLRTALVEQRVKFANYLKDAGARKMSTTWWQSRIDELDRILLLIAQS